jgi:Glycosyltransferase (GlcNAc)/GDP-fucose protein O-fucosyltransferase
MDYVVYSTSNSNYQSWQCRLLEHSFTRVNQQGKLIRLCSHNYHDPDRSFDTSEISEIIKLPDYRTRWTKYTSNVDLDYGIVNKIESLKYWLKHYKGLKDTDVVLFVDPDMIFAKAITQTVEQGTILGQRWIDEGSHDGKPFRTYASHIKDRVTRDTVFMYPYIATVGDLKKIVDRYASLCYKMRLENFPDLWESEMYSLIISALEQNIKVKTIDNLGFCTTWADRDGFTSKEFVDSIHLYHYPWSILNKEGERIFNKQDYTYKTRQEHWDRINPNEATTYLEQQFLQAIDSYNTEKKIDFYWRENEMVDALFDYKPKNKYLVFRPWPGGFNNIRMSLELAACIAFLQNRVLVLPPEYRMYLLNNTNSFSTFFDTQDLGIKTISFEEFEQEFNVQGWEDIEKISYTFDGDVVDTLLTTDIPPDDVINGRKTSDLNLLNEYQVLYFKDNLLGSFYLNIYSKQLPQLCKYVARHIHYNTEIFTEAYKAVEFLNDFGSYYAIHIRRNDFQYKDLYSPIDVIYENIKDVVPEGSKLYVSTDEQDKAFFDLLRQHYQLYFYDDIKHLIYANINVDLIGPIEQIVCTYAKTFIGNKLSTFSSYIYRLRGYMKNITDKRFLTYQTKCQPDEEEPYWWVAVWAREYSQVWESIKDIEYFNPDISLGPKTVFVSIASYRDSQLTDTIDSLFANQSGKNTIIVGACMQDTEENYNSFKYKDHPNVRTYFIPYQDAKGVGFARNLIQQQLFDNEDYFLQIDSHSRACKNWDQILIDQIKDCPSDKAILSTYPNAFDVLDNEQKYFQYDTCPYLKVHQIDESGKVHACSAGIVEKGAPMLGFWIAAGFLFTKGRWCREVVYSKELYFAGEEDHISVMSYVNGWDVYVPDTSTIWHDYTDNRIQSPTKYRPLHWEDHPGVSANLELLKDLYKDAYGTKTVRSAQQFLEIAKKISKYDEHVDIEIQFDYSKTPEPDPSKKVKVIIFALLDRNNKEIFRPDLYDEEIFTRTSNVKKFHIYNHVHENAVSCLWFYKYEDDSFSDRIDLPITKEGTKYIL